MDYNIRHYVEIDSTNTEAHRLSLQDAEEGLVVVAKKQSAGRGRQGRTWESTDADNLYFSLLLRPTITPQKAPMLTLVMAYSVANVLRKYTAAEIKWPNDLVLAGKKICGILTEMHLDGTAIADVVVGVGINVNQTLFSEEIASTATSLLAQTGRRFDNDKLLLEILRAFEQQYEKFLQAENLSYLQEAYNQILANANREVRVLQPNQAYQGTALGINERGELMVRKEDESIEAVYAGEVSVRGIYGYV